MADKISLNKADVTQLKQIRFIGQVTAQNLVNYRNEHGPFKSWDEVEKIPGFSHEIVKYLREGGATIE